MKVIKPTPPRGMAAHSRASTATYINAAGLVATAAINEKRFEYDPISGVNLGLLAEPEAINYFKHSAAFDQAAWSKNGAVIANAAIAPDGTLTADKYNEVAATAGFDAYQAFPTVAGSAYAVSYHFQAAERSLVLVGLCTAGLADGAYAFFDLAAGTVAAVVDAGENVGGKAAIKAMGGGRYRCSVSIVAANTATRYPAFSIRIDQTTGSYLGTAGQGIYVWGAQFEEGAQATSYIPTGAVAVTRAADVFDTSTGLVLGSSAQEVYLEWAAPTAYAVGNRVTRSTTNRIYERVVAGTTPTVPELDLVNWLDYGPTNKWAMFDEQIATLTKAADSLTVTVATGIIDSVALINTNATKVVLTARDGLDGPVIWTGSMGLSGEVVTSWRQYFFSSPLVRKTQALFQRLPSYASMHLTMVLTGGGAISLGNLVFGMSKDIGDTEYNPTASITDYSKKDTDEFGVTTFVRRAYSKRMTANLEIDNLQLNRIQRTLAELRATPCVWIGSDLPEFEETLVVFGFYKDFTITIAYRNTSYCSLEIEGLI